MIQLCLLVLILAVGCATATPTPPLVRIGVLNSDQNIAPVFDGFQQGMSDLGYVEGTTIEYLYNGPVSADMMEAEAARLVSEQVDLVLAITGPAALVMQAAVTGTDIPVIFWTISDPIAAGLVESLRLPGGQITGITIGVEGNASEGRRLELLKQVAPGVERVYIPYNPDDPRVRAEGLSAIEAAAAALDIELLLAEIRTTEEAAASATAIPADADAIFLVFADRTVMSASVQYIAQAIERRIPMTMLNRGGVINGALMSFGHELEPVGVQAARMADQILKGANPAEMSVEIPEFYLSINLKTATAIGLEISESLLLQADYVER